MIQWRQTIPVVLVAWLWLVRLLGGASGGAPAGGETAGGAPAGGESIGGDPMNGGRLYQAVR